MSSKHMFTIRNDSPDKDSATIHDISILMDGVRMKGVKSISLELTTDSIYPTVTLVMNAGVSVTDIPSLVSEN